MLFASNEDRYFKIFDEICRDEQLGAQLITLGTDENHVHLLVRFPPTVTIAKLAQHLKGGFSRRWNKLHPSSHRKFEWGVGYFVKTVGQSTAGETAGYIDRQGMKKRTGYIPATPAA